jgi:hypothetical protein
LPFDLAAMDIDYGIQRPNGQFMSYGEAYERGVLDETFEDEIGRVYASAADLTAGRAFGDQARLLIAGERYPDLVLRDSLVWVATGLVAVGVAAAVVTRRRPA